MLAFAARCVSRIIVAVKRDVNRAALRKQNGRRGDRTPAAASFGKRNPRRLRETRG
jgi:hypothetical protein